MAAIRPGSKLLFQGAVVRILKIVDLNEIEIEDSNRKVQIVPRTALAQIPKEENETINSNEVYLLSDKDFLAANKKWEIIRPIVESPGDGEIVKDVSKKNGIPTTTLYRWVKTYKDSGKIESLAEGRGKKLLGRKNIDEVLEDIISEAIDSKYLTKYRKSITAVIEEVELRCYKKKITPPHRNTIRQRINAIDEKIVLEKRKGKDKAKEIYDPKTGSFPDPVHALQVVQIDHTHIDGRFVDPIYRKLLKGKLILTTAMDVVTKMIIGYYLSFFKPGFVNAGLCISNALLPKEETLKRLKIPGDWPCFGTMSILYMDNGKEFRGYSMERSCTKNKIITTWRPVKNPRFGGNIEALQKTLNTAIHNLPGSTFFNPKHRDNYESEKLASLTFDEIERWLVDFIVNYYHQKVHPELLRPPIAEWRDQIIGSDKIPGIGYQEPLDEEHVKIDFLPSFNRTIQNYGVSHDGITYYSNYLKRFIKTRENKKKLKEYEFRWDPRDLTFIYFLDPEKAEFIKIDLAKIQFRNIKVNIWEYRAAYKELKKKGLKEVNEDIVFESIARRNSIEEKAISEKEKVAAAHKAAKRQNSETKTKKKKIEQQTIDDPFAGIDIDSIKAFN